MANVKELEAQVQELRDLLAAQGIRAPVRAVADEKRPDRIEFGSDRHAALLGLVEVEEGADVSDFFTYTSPGSGRTFRLADEYEPVRTFPAMDPEKAARVILRQKVGELESGPPPVPEDAPVMWQPSGLP